LQYLFSNCDIVALTTLQLDPTDPQFVSPWTYTVVTQLSFLISSQSSEANT